MSDTANDGADNDPRFDLSSAPAEELAQEVDGSDMHVDPLAPPEAGLEAVIRQWRVAKSLERLRAQINAAFPHRSKASDGTIGDPAHQSRSSDHNPWVVDGAIGVVTAFDVTHDPANGCDAGKIAAALRASKDSRLKYIIWNRRIANASAVGASPAWTWRTYTGTNPHNHHCHISVRPEKAAFHDAQDWTFQGQQLPEEALAENAEDAERTLIAADLAALPGNDDRPLLERLVDAQDEIGSLLATHAAKTRQARAEDTEEAPRPTFEQLRPEYEALWAGCVVRHERAGEVAWHRNKLLQYKPRYEQVGAATRAPWWFIGIVHALEASFNFQGHLHNGDPLSVRTVNVPANRPRQWNPPNDWASSAIDAITGEGFAG